MTRPDITGMIAAVERQLPRLSTLQRVLLLTDGSVTILLEAGAGEREDVRTIAQAVEPADAASESGVAPVRGVGRMDFFARWNGLVWPAATGSPAAHQAKEAP